MIRDDGTMCYTCGHPESLHADRCKGHHAVVVPIETRRPWAGKRTTERRCMCTKYVQLEGPQ